MLVGIPHGSLDHLLLPSKGIKSKLRFYLFYLGLIIANLLVWNYSHITGLILFFIISFIIFGESQLFKFKINNKIITHLTYLSWGASVIFSFLFYNIDELQLLSNSFEDTRNLILNINIELFSYLFLLSNIITFIMFILFIYKFKVRVNKVISEVFFLFVIHLSSFLFPLF